MILDFRILSKHEHEMWNRFVATSPQGSLYSKTYYLDALGISYKIGALLNGDNIQAGIVLAQNELRAYSNPMFAKYLGILMRPIEGKYVNVITKEKEFIENLLAHLGPYHTFDYTFHPSFKNWMPFYWKGYQQITKYTYQILNLSDLDAVKQNMHSRVGKNIRKAIKHQVRIESDIPLEEFYRINKMTFERQGGGIPYTFDFLQRFYHQLKKHNAIKFMGALDNQERYHAVCGIVYDEQCSYFILNGINPNVPNYEANTLLVAKAIEYAAKISATFDFEGSMLRPIEQFYRGFGGILTPYFNIWKVNWFNTIKRTAIKAYKKFKYGQ
jgi:hypothetical protein